MKRNGTTSAGRTRWRCPACGASSVRSRPDVTRRAQFAEFLDWLLGSAPQGAAGAASARAFRRRTRWCWNVEPALAVTGEIHDEVQVDGFYLSSNWCCLIASTRGQVIAWQWCDREKSIAWQALMHRVPAPTVTVCDGGTGLLPAIAVAWPDAKIQRCLVHVQRNVRTHLTSRPKTDAGKALWGLARSLTRITTTEQAIVWLHHLHAWHDLHGHLTRERTYLGQQRDGRPAPAWLRPGQRWWYTDSSHNLIEASVRIAGQDAREAYHWARSQCTEEAVLSKADIEALCSIPVIRRGPGPAKRPDVLELPDSLKTLKLVLLGRKPTPEARRAAKAEAASVRREAPGGVSANIEWIQFDDPQDISIKAGDWLMCAVLPDYTRNIGRVLRVTTHRGYRIVWVHEAKCARHPRFQVLRKVVPNFETFIDDGAQVIRGEARVAPIIDAFRRGGGTQVATARDSR